MARAAKAVTPPTEEQLSKIAIKAERDREAQVAMREYRQEQVAVSERTERLRAMRLAREAQSAAAAVGKPAEPVKKPKKVAGVRLAGRRV
jgi:hypothetical protein